MPVFILLLLLVTNHRVYAHEKVTNGLLSMIKLEPDKLTQTRITSLFGQPNEIETPGRKTKWIYVSGETKLTIQWAGDQDIVKKIDYEAQESLIKKKLDYSLPDKLVCGVTDINQAIKIFGLPDDLAIKSSTQEMHYTFEDKILRLFFRNRVLVDFTLY